MVKLLGKEHGKLGYGLMGMTWRDNAIPPEQATPAMKAALDAGLTFWNGGVFYGPIDGYNSNALLKAYFEKYPEDKDRVVISIKGGVGATGPDGTEEGLLKAIAHTNSQLGTAKALDIFEMARVDVKTPIEVTMRAFKKAIEAGNLRGVTLSEVAASTIRRAAKVVPIQGVEVEFSMFETSILHNGVAQTCAELAIPIVAYSPLGRGFLTDQIKSPADIPEGDFRKHAPRFQAENFPKNLEIVSKVKAAAQRKGCTPAQIALSWIVNKSGKNGMPEILPIFGATTTERVKENVKLVDLSEPEMAELDDIVRNADVAGSRYPEGKGSALLYAETPEEQ